MVEISRKYVMLYKTVMVYQLKFLQNGERVGR